MGTNSTERRSIPGYEGRYEIDTDGNVYAMVAFQKRPAGRLNKVRTNKDGYLWTVLYKDGKSTGCYIHRLLMLTFCPIENPHLFEVNHKDLNKTNNDLTNLEWMTHQDNIIHAHKMDAWGERQERGEQINTAKLTADQVRDIRRLHETGTRRRALARQYGVSPENIRAIVLRKTWVHVE